MPTPATELEVGGRTVRVSSPDKIYFPEASGSGSMGLTKLDVVSYVVSVSDGIFAALQDRPVTMERWPGGYRPDAVLSTRSDGHGDAFYQKRAPSRGMPDWVQTATITFPSGRTADEVCTTEPATVAWMANLGTLRWHPWPVKRFDTDKVDQLRIDLDPQPGTDFRDAARAALELRGVLADAGLTGYPKTSGGRGVHVFVPVEPTYGFVEARHAVIAVGRELARRMPDHVTINWWKEERGERIFVDFNQMARDRTIASAYSIRPTPDARVSAPLTWDELDVGRTGRLHHPDDADPVRRARRCLGPVLRRAGRCPGRGSGVVRPRRARPRHRPGGRRRDAVPAGLPEDARRATPGSAEPEERGQLVLRVDLSFHSNHSVWNRSAAWMWTASYPCGPVANLWAIPAGTTST